MNSRGASRCGYLQGARAQNENDVEEPPKNTSADDGNKDGGGGCGMNLSVDRRRTLDGYVPAYAARLTSSLREVHSGRRQDCLKLMILTICLG